MEELENRRGAETPADAPAATPVAQALHDEAPNTTINPNVSDPDEDRGQSLPSRDREGAVIPLNEPLLNPARESADVVDPEDAESYESGEIFVAEAVTASAPAADERIKAVIEAAIYITEEPLTTEQIAQAIQQPIELVKEILAKLTAEYASPSRGLTIRELAGGYKMSTKAEHHEDIRQFVRNLQPQFKLSLAALETLAVIAYKQPITAPEIMEIRGVQGTGVLKTLLDRKLIASAGRKNVVGKPMLYKTTKEFLVQFGLSSLAELPTLKEFEELGRLALNETPDEPAQNAATTGFGDESSSEAVIRPNLEEAVGEDFDDSAPDLPSIATAQDSSTVPSGAHPLSAAHAPVGSPLPSEPRASASGSSQEPEAVNSNPTQHAAEAEAQPEVVTPGGDSSKEDAAQEVSQTHG
jgi:segregation and condensation protein B